MTPSAPASATNLQQVALTGAALWQEVTLVDGSFGRRRARHADRRDGASQVQVRSSLFALPSLPCVSSLTSAVPPARYLLCEVNVADRSRLLLLDDRAVAAAVRAAVARVHGDYGAALCSIRFSGEQEHTVGEGRGKYSTNIH